MRKNKKKENIRIETKQITSLLYYYYYCFDSRCLYSTRGEKKTHDVLDVQVARAGKPLGTTKQAAASTHREKEEKNQINPMTGSYNIIILGRQVYTSFMCAVPPTKPTADDCSDRYTISLNNRAAAESRSRLCLTDNNRNIIIIV